MAAQIRIRATVDQDNLAFAAENGVDEEDLLAAIRAELTADFPQAKVSVKTTTSMNSVTVTATDEDGDDTWTPEVGDVEFRVTYSINAAYEKAIEAAGTDNDA